MCIMCWFICWCLSSHCVPAGVVSDSSLVIANIIVSCACIICMHPKSLICYVDRCVFILRVHEGVQACVYAKCA